MNFQLGYDCMPKGRCSKHAIAIIKQAFGVTPLTPSGLAGNHKITMSQIIEFVSSNALLFLAFFITLGMLVYTEYMRFSTKGMSLTPYDATQKMNQGDSVFIDVRDDSEFKSGHLMNARNMPVNKLAERMHELEKFKNRDIVVYCDNGMRTSRAISRLKKAGFTKLHILNGGLTAWEKANLPTVTK